MDGELDAVATNAPGNRYQMIRRIAANRQNNGNVAYRCFYLWHSPAYAFIFFYVCRRVRKPKLCVKLRRELTKFPELVHVAANQSCLVDNETDF